jgi:hypothetical protein
MVHTPSNQQQLKKEKQKEMIAALIVSIPIWLIALALRDLNNQIKKQNESNTNL